MNSLLEVFLAEARELLQDVGEKLMQLEQTPDDVKLMNALFRSVHTLKGSSGMVELHEMTRVLHAGEDLLDAVRKGWVGYSRELADQLLEAMDFVGLLCEEAEQEGGINASHAGDSDRLAEMLRALIVRPETQDAANDVENCPTPAPLPGTLEFAMQQLAGIPEAARMEAFRRARDGGALHWLVYTPAEGCFYQGDDPLLQARQTPDVAWGKIVAREPWPQLAELDAYRCILDFWLLTAAPRAELDEYYRFVVDQVRLIPVDPLLLVIPQGDPNGGPVYEDFITEALRYLEAGSLDDLRQAAQTLLKLSNPGLWLSSALRWLLLLLDSASQNPVSLRMIIESLRTMTPSDWASITAMPEPPAASPAAPEHPAKPTGPAGALSAEDTTALQDIFRAQRRILMLADQPAWQAGRLKAVARVLVNCSLVTGEPREAIEAALAQALSSDNGAPLLAWLDACRFGGQPIPSASQPPSPSPEKITPANDPAPQAQEEGPNFGRRAEDQHVAKSLKVDQAKIDCLMNLIGEMVVSKNALPYLAQRAEEVHGVRELAREIKSQYAIINRIAEEMQDAIMQVRMMPVSFVFQRFPRLVRDTSRKLGKEVHLVLEGEETEADKNIIESLAEPLIHIIRNSLDHGLETPETRTASGKSAAGTLTIRAAQEADRVLIEIIDDGKGIDPEVIKRKAYEKHLIDETALERITDQEAVNLVFAPGFSTVEVVSDLSGRGVGMDVVRTAVDKVGGSMHLESEKGKGTSLRISLPLSMAVTRVMIVESDRQLFGLPMDHVVETVRVPKHAVKAIKRSLTMVLRGSLVPLKPLNALLGISSEPKTNGDDELAVLVVRVGGEPVGLMVDGFRETVDVIQKPLSGVLASLAAYSGYALMGDGSVLMVLNIKEIV